MSKIKISLPDIEGSKKENVIKELQHNIDFQLAILQDRLSQNILVDLDDIRVVLENTESIVYDCYSTPDFKTTMYKNFSVLLFEYQKLSLRCESAQIEDKIDKLDKKTEQAKNKNENIEDSLKNLLATIIGLFLTFTLIPTAITGIDKINGRYILPFVATLVLFGIIMISFIYIINKVEINGKSWAVILVALVITIGLWILSWRIDIGCDFVEIINSSYQSMSRDD